MKIYKWGNQNMEKKNIIFSINYGVFYDKLYHNVNHFILIIYLIQTKHYLFSHLNCNSFYTNTILGAKGPKYFEN